MENLKGKKVLVTGADGFIGSHLVEELLEEGALVRAFVFYNSFNSWGWLDTLSEEKLNHVEIFAGDIRDTHSVLRAMEGIDTVFHLAALIAIPFSYDSPEAFVDTNVKGTLNILQAARVLGTKRVLVTSTSEVYGTAQYVPIDEKHPFQGQSPYSATKIGADRLAESFYRSFDLPVTIVRPFNTYGPRQSARAVIPTIITQILNGETKVRLGRTDPIRDLNYVKDVARAFINIAQSGKTIGEELNISSGVGYSVREVADMIFKISGKTAEIIKEEVRVRPEKSEVEKLIGSSEKISSMTGWKPSYDIQKGLEETIAWFRDSKNLSRYKHKIYNQ